MKLRFKILQLHIGHNKCVSCIHFIHKDFMYCNLKQPGFPFNTRCIYFTTGYKFKQL